MPKTGIRKGLSRQKTIKLAFNRESKLDETNNFKNRIVNAPCENPAQIVHAKI